MGVGDPYGMHAAHAIVSGMGGIRTAGDLVARLQLNRSMKIDAAKKYVADKLGASVADMADEVAMREIREDLENEFEFSSRQWGSIHKRSTRHFLRGFYFRTKLFD